MLPRPPSWWDLLPLPKNSTPLSAFGLDFWRLGPHWVASPQSPHFPQCVRVLIKILLVPIFGAKECIRMQDFVLKYTKNNSGGPDPRNPAPGGEKFVRTHPHAHPPNAGAPPHLLGWLRPCPTPCPPAKCCGPSASSKLATALDTITKQYLCKGLQLFKL